MNIYIAELDNKYKLHTFEKERLIDELPARDWQDVSSFCRVDSPISRELRPYEKLWHLNEEDWRQRTINSEEAKIIAEGIAAAQDRFASLYIKHDEILGKIPPCDGYEDAMCELDTIREWGGISGFSGAF